LIANAPGPKINDGDVQTSSHAALALVETNSPEGRFGEIVLRELFMSPVIPRDGQQFDRRGSHRFDGTRNGGGWSSPKAPFKSQGLHIDATDSVAGATWSAETIQCLVACLMRRK